MEAELEAELLDAELAELEELEREREGEEGRRWGEEEWTGLGEDVTTEGIVEDDNDDDGGGVDGAAEGVADCGVSSLLVRETVVEDDEGEDERVGGCCSCCDCCCCGCCCWEFTEVFTEEEEVEREEEGVEEAELAEGLGLGWSRATNLFMRSLYVFVPITECVWKKYFLIHHIP